jgi:CxxC motif-containing protein
LVFIQIKINELENAIKNLWKELSKKLEKVKNRENAKRGELIIKNFLSTTKYIIRVKLGIWM